MKTLESIINFLQFEMTKPTNYGWFHIMCLIILALLIIFLKYKKYNLKKTILTLSIIMVVFEIYKQLSFSFDGTWNYQWYIFPFQFCSTPMYVGLVAGLTKNKKIEQYCYSFLATYTLVAGLSVMFYPNTVFVSETLINIQTMVHHGFMVVMGCCILFDKRITRSFKTIKEAFTVFIILVTVALLIDVITYYIGINDGLEMFFISPFHTSTLPVFDIIYDKVVYPFFLFIYIIVFTIGSLLPLSFSKKKTSL